MKLQHSSLANTGLIPVPAEYKDMPNCNLDELRERMFIEQCKKSTEELWDNFSFNEHIQIAFVPLVISHIAFDYGKKCREASAKSRISILRPLTRAFDTLHKDYISEISIDLNYAHRKQIEEQSERFIAQYARDFQILWFTVNQEFKRLFPDYPYDTLRTDALCGVLMVDMLYQHNKRVDKLLESKLKRPSNSITNPKMDSLRHLLLGFAGEVDRFDFSALNITLAIKVLLKRIYEIQFVISK